MQQFLSAIFLGFIEGLTEFIPVSSTGHLVVIADWIGFVSRGHVFEVFIQLGAILAVVFVYRDKIFKTVVGLPREKKAQKFALNVIAACIPIIIVGAALHNVIKALFLPSVIAATLIIGGIIILALEKKLKEPVIDNVDDIPLKTAFKIGCLQTLALIPGISRSGATIMGARAMGLSKAAAAEFSFFVAIPVMCAATLYDTYKNWSDIIHYGEFPLLMTGFAVAFITALFLLKAAISFINRYGFEPFGWYRIAAGLIVAAALLF